MKIVLGIDDSPHSQAAVEFVRTTAWPAGSVVIVVSSVPLPSAVLSTTSPLTGLEVGVWLNELIKVHTQLAEGAERKLAAAGLTVRTQVPQGDPRDCLIDAARSEGADLMVVGSHGRRGLDRLLLGSVAAHVVSHSPCSVLVVKSGD